MSMDSQSGRGPGSGPERPPRWLPLAALAVCLGYFGVEVWLLSSDIGFPLDDSWIHLQFARNLAESRGLSYNPGELVTGSTAPLWTALLSLLFLLPGNIVFWTKLLGIALHVASVNATWKLARELDLPRGLAGLAALLTLGTSWLAWSALSGMEVPLFVLLSLQGIRLHLRERADAGRLPLSLPVLAVASLARPEGLLLIVLAVIDRFLVFERVSEGGDDELRWKAPAWRPLLAGLGLAALALAGPLLFYRWAGGSFLPTTFAAKGAAGPRRLLPDLQYVYVVMGIFFRAQPFATLLAGGGGAALLARLGTARDRGLLPALWLLGLPLAYATLTPSPQKLLGNFGRYHFPLFPVLVILAALALEPAARALGARARLGGLRLPLGPLLAGAMVATSAWLLAQGAVRYARNVANVQDSDVRIARWLAGRLHPDAVLAVNDIGAIKFLLPNRVVDLAAIANPEIRGEVARDMAAGADFQAAMIAAVERRKPDYIIVFPAWLPGLMRDPRFRPLQVLPIPDNITMGGDEIAVLATPWTRYPLAVESPP